MATDREMKALLVLALVIVAAATALAYAPAEMASMVVRPAWITEPAALLVSGSALLAVGSALRRLT